MAGQTIYFAKCISSRRLSSRLPLITALSILFLSLPPDASVPVEPADFWSMYIPGVHGLVLYYRGKSATFLPKVHIIMSLSLSLSSTPCLALCDSSLW